MNTAINACDWHDGRSESDGESCPNCGKLLADRQCDGCGKYFLDWEAKGYDDIVAGPAASEGGDLCCTACVRELNDLQTDCEYDDRWYDEGDDTLFDQHGEA